MKNDTIIALATAPLPSAIGIIRISGPKTLELIEATFNVSKSEIKPRYNEYRSFHHPETDALIDDCCFTYFKDQASYTGESSCEIYCHGSMYIIKTIIDILTSFPDCRLAKHGEFTERAFINGKINLTKAESIIDLIESKDEQSHQIALSQYQGSIYKKIIQYRTILMEILQEIEASLEFPDEVGSINSNSISKRITDILSAMQTIIATSDYGQSIKHGLSFLIIGEPNVGKSSLLNCLSGNERSIVSNEAGTTRDYIDITIEYNGIQITFIDTAGLRSTQHSIEAIGINKIEDAAKSTHGTILLLDGSKPIPTNAQKIIPSFIDPDKPIIETINKMDILNDANSNRVNQSTVQKISSKENTGIHQLKQACIDQVIDKTIEPDEMLSNIRQISCLKSAFKILQTIETNINDNWSLDIISIDLRNAINNLSELIGDDFTEELLDGIFSRFCIGK